MEEWVHRLAIRDVAYRYAQAVDRRNYRLLAEQLSEDLVLIGPGFHYESRAAYLEGVVRIEYYHRTMHCVHNQLVEVRGQQAAGETYCVAYHFYHQEEQERRLVWGIRYQDEYRREEERWLLSRRELLLDWSTDAAVTAGG